MKTWRDAASCVTTVVRLCPGNVLQLPKNATHTTQPNYAPPHTNSKQVERGEGCWLFDEAGTPYLDCVNNVAHVGHGNAAVSRQSGWGGGWVDVSTGV